MSAQPEPKSTSGSDLLEVKMQKHTSVSRIAFGQGGTVIDVELSQDDRHHRGNSTRGFTCPEFITVKTHNGRYQMTLRHVSGSSAQYLLYAVNWVSKGMNNPLRLPEGLLDDFGRAILGLGMEIDVVGVDDHFRYTCARNVFEELDDLDLPVSCDEVSAALGHVGTAPYLHAALPLDFSMTVVLARDLMSWTNQQITDNCRRQKPGAAGSAQGSLHQLCTQYVRGVNGMDNGLGRSGDSSSFVSVMRINCGDLERHEYRKRFFQYLLTTTGHVKGSRHPLCPRMVAQGNLTWNGEQYFFFDRVPAAVPMYVLTHGGGSRNGSAVPNPVTGSLSPAALQVCVAELQAIKRLFTPASDFLVLFTGDDVALAENFVVNAQTGQVYLWSFRDVVYFHGNKTVLLGFLDRDQSLNLTKTEICVAFGAAIDRLCQLLLK
mmetsp:Transcript_3616/g.5354  ORF Transcript_3616/g.5354 Transcript_3616/m.5354 type:complete len:433 (+) Transcript_3616:176-1474(+)